MNSVSKKCKALSSLHALLSSTLSPKHSFYSSSFSLNILLLPSFLYLPAVQWEISLAINFNFICFLSLKFWATRLMVISINLFHIARSSVWFFRHVQCGSIFHMMVMRPLVTEVMKGDASSKDCDCDCGNHTCVLLNFHHECSLHRLRWPLFLCAAH